MHKLFNWFGLPGKLILTSLISLTAVVLSIADPTLTRIVCIPAMLASSLGDIILMDYKPVTTRLPVRGFIAGASVFAFAHVIYFCAFLCSVKNYFNAGAWAGIALFVAVSAAVVVICRSSASGTSTKDGKMLPLCILYLFFIALNYTTVYSCAAAHGGRFLISAVGVTLFLISDLFIVADSILGAKIKNSDFWIWTFYPIGQILLLAGA